MSEDALITQSDEELLASTLAHDETAFSELYDRYSPLLYAVCLRILRRPFDAQAVLSEIFWEVWRHANRFNPNRGSARTYLLMLARSRAIDRLRAETGRQTHEAEYSREKNPSTVDLQHSDDPVRLAITEENSHLVSAALDELSSVQRQALQLAFFDGLTHREVAQHMNAPLGTVKTHIRQGLKRLNHTLRTIDTEWTEP